jgi:hypothetical protein
MPGCRARPTPRATGQEGGVVDRAERREVGALQFLGDDDLAADGHQEREPPGFGSPGSLRRPSRTGEQ